MSQDEEHLRLLSIFHFVVGGLTALLGCLPVFHVGFGLFFLFGNVDFDGGAPPESARIFGGLFVVIGLLVMLFNWTLAGLLIVAGRRLAQRRSHTFCTVVAAIQCVMFPFGTALGVFTLIVLCRPSVKQLFGLEITP